MMFDADTLIDDLWMELNMVSTGFDQFVVDNLVKNYTIPSFNRDYPQIQTIGIRNKSRFYPYTDFTGTTGSRFLSHIFLIKQDNAMFMYLQSQMGWESSDNFVSIASTDLVQKIMRFSYKNSCFVHSPVILYDDVSNDYYYNLDSSSRYILIYSILNNVDSTTMIHPNEYEALKWYSM